MSCLRLVDLKRRNDYEKQRPKHYSAEDVYIFIYSYTYLNQKCRKMHTIDINMYIYMYRIYICINIHIFLHIWLVEVDFVRLQMCSFSSPNNGL